jgi:hypothetical protein
VQAAIELDGLAGHVRVPHDEKHRLRNFLDGAEPAEGDARRGGSDRRNHFGVNQGWRDGVDGDPRAGESRGVAACQPLHPGFRGVVVHANAARAARRAGADVHDAAEPKGAHAGQHCLRAQERGLQIDPDGAIEILFGQVFQATWRRDPGIVHQDTDRTERGFDRVRHAGDRRAVRHVGGGGQRAAPERA